MDTYNDLNEGELIIKEEEDSEKERWVSKHVFLVQDYLQNLTGSDTLKYFIWLKFDQVMQPGWSTTTK